MHRSTLLTIGAKYGKPAPWFSEGTIYKGLTFGEDWAFCMRAKDLGIPIYVLIPQKGNTHLTEAVLKQLDREDVTQVLVMDNGTDELELAAMDPAVLPHLHPMPEASIHRMWNEGIKLAREHAQGPFNLAILNNDIRLGPHAIKRMATALRADDTLLAVCPSYGTKGC